MQKFPEKGADLFVYVHNHCTYNIDYRNNYLYRCNSCNLPKYIAALYVDGNNINITIKHNHCGQRYLKSYMVFNNMRNEWVQSGYINVIETNIR